MRLKRRIGTHWGGAKLSREMAHGGWFGYNKIVIVHDDSTKRLSQENLHRVLGCLDLGSWRSVQATSIDIRNVSNASGVDYPPAWIRQPKRTRYDTRFESLACSPDGRFLAAGGQRQEQGTITLWNAITGTKCNEFFLRPPEQFTGGGYGVTKVALQWSTPDCVRFVASIRFAAGENKRSVISGWLNVNTKGITYTSISPRWQEVVASLALSRDGTHVAVGRGFLPNRVQILRVDTTQFSHTVLSPDQSDHIQTISFHTDRSLFGSTQNHIFEAKIPEQARGTTARSTRSAVLPPNTNISSSLVVSPNGKYVVVGRYGGSLSLHNSDDGEIVRSFTIPAGVGDNVIVQSLAFSPNGHYLFCAATQGAFDSRFSTMYMFQVSSGALLYVF
ncbi:MAG: hypothetical protein AAF355_11235 [Myxococcota bacterium]